MKRYVFYSLAVIISVCCSSCSSGQYQDNFNLAPLEFQKQLQKNPSAPLIDVRTPEEYSKGHLQNSVNIDWNGKEFEESISKLDKSAPVFVYCLSGGRSSSAVDKMHTMGFNNVYELNGGISQWRNAGLPEITNPESKSTGMTKEQLDSILSTDKLVLIDFYAEWCAPCKKMESYLEELKTEMKDKVTVIRIDADENPFLFKELKVAALPTLLLYKDKKLVWSHAGYISKEDVLKHF